MSPSRPGGFTLIEVLAAILLLAVAFAALLKVAGASTALARDAAERTTATLWAQSLLDGSSAGAVPPPGRSAGRFDARYAWELDVSPWPGNAPVPPQAAPALALYRIDLVVRWGSPGRPRSLHFQTLRAAGPARAAAGGAP